MVNGLSIRERLPQIEVAMGDGPCVLVFRVLDSPSDQDLERLRSFGETVGFCIFLQDGGVETVRPLPGHEVDLSYSLPHYEIGLHFEPSDFTQVNLELNRADGGPRPRAARPQPDERVLDLFCGLGQLHLAPGAGRGRCARGGR